ncbi:MAG: sensor domain-containing diguanylate cyclase [Synergistota bacterium]|nr:sensor domain-containing diguanylate cyclase [Synergistota bacterium]
MLHAIVRDISREQNITGFSEKLASLLAEHLHYRNVTFLRNDAGAGKTKLCIIASSGLGKDHYVTLSKQLNETGRGLTLRAANEMRIINTPDVGVDPGFVPLVCGATCELDVPIVEGDRLLGIICVEGEAPFTTEDEEVFSLMAGHIASRWTTLELMDELKLRSRSDQLTGLANRYALFDHIGAEQSRLERYGGSCTIIMADMANFKQLNDTYGHLVGDHCLKAAAGSLKKAVRQSDFVARYGGDEFVIIMPSMPEAELETFLERLREGLGELKVNGMDLGLEADIGVAVWPGDSRKIVKVLKAADDRMYEHKRSRQASNR